MPENLNTATATAAFCGQRCEVATPLGRGCSLEVCGMLATWMTSQTPGKALQAILRWLRWSHRWAPAQAGHVTEELQENYGQGTRSQCMNEEPRDMHGFPKLTSVKGQVFFSWPCTFSGDLHVADRTGCFFAGKLADFETEILWNMIAWGRAQRWFACLHGLASAWEYGGSAIHTIQYQLRLGGCRWVQLEWFALTLYFFRMIPAISSVLPFAFCTYDLQSSWQQDN